MYIPQDEMTPLERVTAFVEGKPFDRIPCCPFLEENFSHMFGRKISEFHQCGEINTEIAIQTFKTFRTDSAGVNPGLHGLAEAMGCTLAFPDFRTPYITAPAINSYSPDQLDRLGIIDPTKDGRLPMIIESLLRVRDAIGHEVSVDTLVGGPFTTAAFLRGTDRFLRDMHTDPENVHKLLQISTDNVIRYIDHMIDLGFIPSIPEPVASATIIGKKQFDTFVLPYLKQCFDHMRERTGQSAILHICGRTKPLWSSMVATGADAISLDNAESMAELKEAHGKDVCIIGNIDPINVLMKGSIETVDHAVKTCIDESADSPNGFILSSGCDVPIGTPRENIHAMMDAVRKYGR